MSDSPPTAAQLRADADRIEAEGEARAAAVLKSARTRAAELRGAAAVIEAYLAASGNRDLPSSPDTDTIGTMPEGQTFRTVKIGLHRGPQLKLRGPAATAAKKMGMSLRGFSKKIGEDYELLKKRDARKTPLPDAVQKKIDKALADHARKTDAE